MAQFKPSQDLRPMSELKSHGAEIVRHVTESGRPTLLTRHGRGVAVVLSLERFEALEEAAAGHELLAALAVGEADIAAGQLVDQATVVDRLRRWAEGE